MSSSASSVVAMWSFSSVARSVSDHPKCSRMRSALQPRALRSTVTGWRRLRSIRTPTVERLSTSEVLSSVRSKYTPGERTSWLTTTRSVPLMMNVPLGVITGKSPMNTVWLLISPVVLFVNSAVTNSGAAKVMSLSLHSSMDALTSSKRGLEKERRIGPEKSSRGEISPRISSRPDWGSATPSAATRDRHRSLPTSQSKDSVCSARRFGTSSGSRILAKEVRVGEPGIPNSFSSTAVDLPEREDAKTRPSEDTSETTGATFGHHEVSPSRAAEVSEGSATSKSNKLRHSKQGLTLRGPRSHVARRSAALREACAGRSQVRGNCASLAARRQALRQTYPLGHSRYTSRYRAFPAIRSALSVVFAELIEKGPGQGSRAEQPHGIPPLLERDGGAGTLQGLLGLVGRLPVDLLEDWLRSAVDKILGLLQAQAGERADLLDDLDLLLARGLEDDVEFVLLLLGLGRCCRAAWCSLNDGGRRRRGDVEGLFELLHEVRQLEQRHFLERAEQLVGAELRHDVASFLVSRRFRRQMGQSVISAGSAGVSGSGWAAAADAGALAAACFSSSAFARRAIWESGAWNSVAARVGSAFIAPASRASKTSRDSRSAIRATSAPLSAFPSSTPPLITNSGLARAKSRRPFATTTGSPVTKAIAVGPTSRLSSSPMPAFSAARLVSVFLTMA